jgi:hypothetical protein
MTWPEWTDEDRVGHTPRESLAALDRLDFLPMSLIPTKVLIEELRSANRRDYISV